MVKLFNFTLLRIGPNEFVTHSVIPVAAIQSLIVTEPEVKALYLAPQLQLSMKVESTGTLVRNSPELTTKGNGTCEDSEFGVHNLKVQRVLSELVDKRGSLTIQENM